MIGKAAAFHDLSEFVTLIREGLRDYETEVGKAKYSDNWTKFQFATVKIKIGALDIDVYRHGSTRAGYVDVHVWNFGAHPLKKNKFSMGGRVPHVARVVADYVNEYEGE